MDIGAEFGKIKKVLETLADKVVFHTEVEKTEVATILSDIGSTIEDAKTAVATDTAAPVVAATTDDEDVTPGTDEAVVDPLAGYTLEQLQAELAARTGAAS